MKKKPDTSLGFSEQISEMANAMELTSAEEIGLLTQQMTETHNQRKLDHFNGLSPEQMSRFMYSAFESPALVSYSADIDGLTEVPAMMIMTMLLDGLGDDGLKLTQKGNLPLKLCKFVLPHYYGMPGNKHYYVPNLRSELDFEPLHSIRRIAEMAGLIRKLKGRLVLTKKGKKLRMPEQRAALFLLLFQTYSEPFNWAYRDRYSDARIVQYAFLYTLYLISQYGGSRQLDKFYEDKFIFAFPMAIAEMEETVYSAQEDQLRRCYTLRSMERFAHFFGFINMVYEDDKEIKYKKKKFITKTAFFDEFIQFNV